MAPEQISDPLHAGHGAISYSVGILLFEMLSGSSPFSGRTTEDLVSEALAGHLGSLAELAPNTPQGLVEVVMRATALRRRNGFGPRVNSNALWFCSLKARRPTYSQR